MAKQKTQPVVYDPKDIADALVAAEGDVSAAARAIGCTRITIYRQRKLYPEVDEAYNTFRPQMLERAKSGMMAILGDPDHLKHYDACKFVCETQGKNEGFSPRQEVTGADGANMTVLFVPATEEDAL